MFGVAVLLGVAVLALGGCGSGSSSGTTSAGSGSRSGLDRATLAARANAICATFKDDMLGLVGDVSVTDPSSVQRMAIRAHGLSQKLDGELAALVPDAQSRAQWDALLALLRRRTDLYAQSEASARTGDAVGIARAATRLATTTKQVGEAANAVGATTCGPGPV